MAPDDLKAWREARNLNQTHAATLLGLSRRAFINYETGGRIIPPELAARIGAAGDDAEKLKASTPKPAPKPEPSSEVSKLARGAIERAKSSAFSGDPWEAPGLSKVERLEIRYSLEPGSRGWKYRPGSTLPNGQFIEVIDNPQPNASGSISRRIQWCSNGVGSPSMILQGTTVGADNPDAEALGPGVYRSFRPNAGNGDAPTPDGGKRRKAA